MSKTELVPGTLILLVLRVLESGPLHGYAIAQRIRQVSGDVLRVEEGSLYPALQKMLLKGWVRADWACPTPSAAFVRTASPPPAARSWHPNWPTTAMSTAPSRPS